MIKKKLSKHFIYNYLEEDLFGEYTLRKPIYVRFVYNVLKRIWIITQDRRAKHFTRLHYIQKNLSYRRMKKNFLLNSMSFLSKKYSKRSLNISSSNFSFIKNILRNKGGYRSFRYVIPKLAKNKITGRKAISAKRRSFYKTFFNKRHRLLTKFLKFYRWSKRLGTLFFLNRKYNIAVGRKVKSIKKRKVLNISKILRGFEKRPRSARKAIFFVKKTEIKLVRNAHTLRFLNLLPRKIQSRDLLIKEARNHEISPRSGNYVSFVELQLTTVLLRSGFFENSYILNNIATRKPFLINGIFADSGLTSLSCWDYVSVGQNVWWYIYARLLARLETYKKASENVRVKFKKKSYQKFSKYNRRFKKKESPYISFLRKIKNSKKEESNPKDNKKKFLRRFIFTFLEKREKNSNTKKSRPMVPKIKKKRYKSIIKRKKYLREISRSKRRNFFINNDKKVMVGRLLGKYKYKNVKSLLYKKYFKKGKITLKVIKHFIPKRAIKTRIKEKRWRIKLRNGNMNVFLKEIYKERLRAKKFLNYVNIKGFCLKLAKRFSSKKFMNTGFNSLFRKKIFNLRFLISNRGEIKNALAIIPKNVNFLTSTKKRFKKDKYMKENNSKLLYATFAKMHMYSQYLTKNIVNKRVRKKRIYKVRRIRRVKRKRQKKYFMHYKNKKRKAQFSMSWGRKAAVVTSNAKNKIVLINAKRNNRIKEKVNARQTNKSILKMSAKKANKYSIILPVPPYLEISYSLFSMLLFKLPHKATDSNIPTSITTVQRLIKSRNISRAKSQLFPYIFSK